MIDFGKWFNAFRKKPEEATTPDPQLELADKIAGMGLDLMKNGEVWGACRCCGRKIVWTDHISVEEILRDGVGEDVCGGSPSCLP